MPLQAIVATGDEASDNVVVQTLDAAGRTLASYAWNDWACDTPCWVNDDFEKVEGVTIDPGQGLWVQGLSLDQGIQTSGQVGREDVIVVLTTGCTAAGNPFPVAINLQDIVADGVEVSDNVVIQTLDAAGRTLTSYAWNDWACENPCWVNDDFEKVEGVTIAPGQGVWVQGLSNEQSIRFPASEF